MAIDPLTAVTKVCRGSASTRRSSGETLHALKHGSRSFAGMKLLMRDTTPWWPVRETKTESESDHEAGML